MGEAAGASAPPAGGAGPGPGAAEAPRPGFAREAALYGVGVVVARAVSFVMLPVYTRFLSPSDYGVLQILQMVLDVTAILLSGGLASGVLRFTLKAKTAEERHGVVSTAFLLLTGLHATGALILFALAPWISRTVL